MMMRSFTASASKPPFTPAPVARNLIKCRQRWRVTSKNSSANTPVSKSRTPLPGDSSADGSTTSTCAKKKKPPNGGTGRARLQRLPEKSMLHSPAWTPSGRSGSSATAHNCSRNFSPHPTRNKQHLTLPMNFRQAHSLSGRTHVSLAVLLACSILLQQEPILAAPIAVRHTEGLVHGFLTLRSQAG